MKKIKKIFSSFFIFLFFKNISFCESITLYGAIDIVEKEVESEKKLTLFGQIKNWLGEFYSIVLAVIFLIIGVVCINKKISNKAKIIISAIGVVLAITISIIKFI